MSENLYCDGNRQNNNTLRNGWYRTFKGYPEVNGDVWKLIKGLSEKKLLLFFIEYVTLDKDYANFLTREVLNGNWSRRSK